jgi:hypothetical protein
VPSHATFTESLDGDEVAVSVHTDNDRPITVATEAFSLSLTHDACEALIAMLDKALGFLQEELDDGAISP